MPARLEEITVTFLQERHRFANADGDTIIGRAWMNGSECKEIAIKGQADLDELQPEQDYRLYGVRREFKAYDNALQQLDKFEFKTFVLKQPHSRTGVVTYLKTAGQGFGFSTARATKLWEWYGPDAVKMLRENPEEVSQRLQSVSGLKLSLENAKAIAAVLAQDAALEGCTLDLLEILNGRGFRKELPRWLTRDFGNEAAAKVRANPFILIEQKYAGCGFRLCDALWLSLKLPPDSIVRQAYCVLYACESEKNGSTWIPRTVAEAALKGLIGAADVRIDEAIAYAVQVGLISECRTNGANGPLCDTGNISWLAIRANAEMESRLAELVSQAMAEPHCWPDLSAIENIDGEQPEVLKLVLRGSVAILGGRPGTGKTFTAANLIKALLRSKGDMTVGIGAPTNLAAQRLNQAMAGYEVPVKARTNHSLLGRPRLRGHQWNHDESNPLPYKVLVFDEESMKDAAMMCAIFQARAKGTMVLLIGDINQLPPVGRGAPLRDMIAAGLPYGELTKIRRNSGGIVEACAAIAEGRPWGPGDNLEIIPVDDEAGQAAAVIDKLRECRESGFDPVWDSRVIVPQNITRRALNKLVQGELNPNPAIDGCVFRLGDKVICRENKDFKTVSFDQTADAEDFDFTENGEVRVSNGELGKVLEIKPGQMIVEVFAPKRVVRVPLGKVSTEPAEANDDGSGEKDKTGTGCAFDLAYAVTFHSSQGSEFPWPILVASSRDSHMGYRELPYTGISRGKAKCKMIGLKAVWDRFCRRVALNQRKTFLKERILLAQAEAELGDL